MTVSRDSLKIPKFSLLSTLKNPKLLPKSFGTLPFEQIKNDILGKDYELSIVTIGKARSKQLNGRYRGKDYPTDVLSFNLSKKVGEIFITPEIAKKKAPDFDYTFEEYLLFLVIHACSHLKGMQHGSKMRDYELAHYSRYRRRHL